MLSTEIKNKKIAVIGLGYVGLPLLIEFAKHHEVIAYDISAKKITQLSQGIDITKEVDDNDLKKCNAFFTNNPEDLKPADIFIVTVPTPIDENNKPNLAPLISASRTIGKQLSKGNIVVFESTVYPGVTEEVCAPILEEESKLTFGKDFELGYSPERISPGEKNRTLTKIMKIVSGSTPETLAILAKLYGNIISAGIYKATSIKVAEAAKVIENIQRDLNVALMNELSIIFNKMGINTLDVIDAASTKWNFMKMSPGLVGGHCIGVDPYYLTFKAEQINYHPDVILAGRRINDAMGHYVANQTVKHLIKAGVTVNKAKVLVMGITFKENVSDIRNSKVIDIIKELKDYQIDVQTCDPLAIESEIEEEYQLKLSNFNKVDNVDAIILATQHDEYKKIKLDQLFKKFNSNNEKQVLIDIKGIYRHERETLTNTLYWSL